MSLSKTDKMRLFQRITDWSTDKMRANKKAIHDIVCDGDAITYKEQNLTEEQKAQARENINAANDSEVVKHIPQNLTSEQKAQARENINVLSTTEIFEYLQRLGIDASYKDYMEWFYSENPLKRPLTIEAIFDDTYISLNNQNKYSNDLHAEPISILYSTDEGITWNTVMTGDNICKLNAGERVLIKGNNTCYDGHRFYPQPAYIYGNMMSLIQEKDFDNITEVSEYCFAGLFEGFEDGGFQNKDGYQIYLPATTLAKGCYEEMFKYTSLKDAPELPATTLEVGCYQSMFENCTSLVNAQKELPGNILKTSSYYKMFRNCTELKESPLLCDVNGSIPSGCYESMFEGCSNLDKVNFGIKGTLSYAAFSTAFRNFLKNVSQTGTFIVDLTSTTTPSNFNSTGSTIGNWEREFYNAFIIHLHTSFQFRLISTNWQYSINGGTWNRRANAVSLNEGTKIYIKAYANLANYTIPSSGVYDLIPNTIPEEAGYSVSGDIAALLFNNPATATAIQRCVVNNVFSQDGAKDYIISAANLKLLNELNMKNSCYERLFSGCAKLIDAPKLPAINLTQRCYAGMFYNCISLNSAPELPAKILVNNCYEEMFAGCTSLSYVKALFDEPNNAALTDWLTGVSSTGTYVKSKDAIYNPVEDASVPAGWTIETEAEPSSDEDVTPEVSTARKLWTGSAEKYAQLTPSNDTIYFITP